MEEKQSEQELKHAEETQEVVSAGSDVEMIEVNTPNFFGRHFLHLLAVFGVGFLIFIFTFEIYFTPIYIIGGSMQPTINKSITYANDDEHCDIVYYRPKENYDIGDILIVNAVNYLPTAQKSSRPVSSIIKRLIAKPGQNITFVIINAAFSASSGNMTISYHLLVDGVPDPIAEKFDLGDTYVMSFPVYPITFEYSDVREYADYTLTKELWGAAYPHWTTLSETNPATYSLTVGDGELFACGDNRNNSTDSRWFGPVKQSDVMGNVRIHVPYGTNLLVALWRLIFG